MGTERDTAVASATASCTDFVRAMPMAAGAFALDPVTGALKLVYANAALGAFFEDGVTLAVGARLESLFPGAHGVGGAAFAQIARAAGGQSFEFARGPLAIVMITAFPLGDGGVGILAEDVTQRRRSERVLREANVFLDSVVDNIPDMVFIKDAEHLRFQRVNRAGSDLLGLPLDELLGKSDHDLFPRDQAAHFQARDREVLAARTLLDIPEEPIETAHGERWLHTKKIPLFDERGAARFLLGISEDITERRRSREALARVHEELEGKVLDRTKDLQQANSELRREAASRQKAERALKDTEAQLRQSQKMEAIGRLAGGMAHDFNNLLSVVLSYSELLLRDLEGDARKQADVEEVRRAAVRGGELTRQLLAFGRRQVLEPRVIDLNDVLHGMDRMLRRLVGEDIEIVLSPSPALASVHVDPGQMEQVLLNLVVNARDAMPNGGRLTLKTANVDDGSAEQSILDAGPHVMMAVSDSGTGMSPEILERIFEPFFTTKEVGKGTGLGLSTVFGIVKQSGGSIEVVSELEQGTTFRVYLPRTSRPRTALRPARAEAPPARGSETILVVDDESQIRHVARSILERQGYTVILAAGAAEALAWADAHPGTLDLVVTDVIMPKRNGRRLAEELQIKRPRLRVLYMSGYTENAVVHGGILDEGLAFLRKPFTPDSLAHKVRESLDAEPEP